VRALDPRLLRRARPVRVLLGVDVAIGLATAACVLLQAILLADALARAFSGAPAAELARDLVLLAVVFALRGALAWSFEIAGRRAAASVLSGLRLALVEQRLRTQPAALDRVEAGEIAAAAVHGIDGLEAYFARYLPQLVLACVVPVLVVIAVAAVDLGAALVLLLTLPLVPLFMWLIGRYTEQRTRERWHALRLLSAHFLDVLRGLPTLRAFNHGPAQRATVAAVGERYRRATMETLRVGFLSGSVLELAATLGVALVAVTVGVRLANGGLELQAALTVLILAPELYLPLRRLGAHFHASADGLAVAERMLDLLDERPEDARAPRRPAPSPARSPVRLEDVSFAYPARPGLVLDRFGLVLAPGETVALVGPSGSGKSTIAALLLGLAQPTAGRITVGGVDLATCDPGLWRRNLAWLPQRPVLFRGTVADNIRLGDPQAGEDRVRRAAILAGAEAVVRALPASYGTVVGDGGRPLSSGERRRIALARAFLRDAPFVILDEPTADLDPESAALVGEAVDRLRVGRTVLLVSHRPQLAVRADRVVSVDGGRAVLTAAMEAA
jgi:thiol reductant ABC exporter CydD subunit